MNAAERTRGENEPASGTLGAVLYADRGKTQIPESDWVALVRLVAEGDQHALHALYQRAHRIVFTLSVRITNSRETAEEVTVDVFHDVWRRASTYDAANGTVLGWIMNQARSRAIDRSRFELRKKRVAPQSKQAASEALVEDSADPTDLAEQRRLLSEALAVLSARERQAIEVAFFSELTYSEVARQLDEPVGTVKTRIRSGLSKLREALRQLHGKEEL
ncbi:MAG TPA: sigma-70 family RNA polymerase sigma factor [Gammaproteobacteria bacterium]|jgi:RNA polymerase sigma-70 factor, ECF subfamily|nr:sigma-70 family RNA polymerase sigma factor [Gammaproteobacteria bacterium]